MTKGIIDEFAIYLNYVRRLGFEETPDDDFLRALFAKVMKTQIYDWGLLNVGVPLLTSGFGCFDYRH